MEIRKSTAVAFARKHIEPLQSDPAVLAALTAAREELTKIVDQHVKAQIGEIKNTDSWPYRKVVLNKDLETEIDRKAKEIVEKVVEAKIKQAISAWCGEEDLETKIAKMIETRVGPAVRKVVEKKLEERQEDIKAAARFGKLELE